MKQLKNTFKRLWKDESAQGATEYILLLVVVVAVVIVFKDKIKSMIETKMGSINDSVQSFSSGD